VDSPRQTFIPYVFGAAGAIAFGMVLLFLFPAVPAWLVLFLTTMATGILIAGFEHPHYLAYRQQVQRKNEDLHFKDVIYDFVVESAKLDKREDLYNLILQKAVEAIPNAKMASLLKVTEGCHMRFEAAYGHNMDILRTIELNIEETFSHVLTNGKYDRTVIVNDFHAFNQKVLDEERYDTLNSATESVESIISAPVLIDSKLWGMINIDSDAFKSFGQEHIERLGIFVNEMCKVIKIFRQQELNTWLMNYDTLTSLLNRRHFTELLRADLARAKEGTLSGTLVSMDLDNFKHINDQFGHLNGDQALVHFANGFQGHLGEGDYLSRYGGDEFVAVFPGKKSSETEPLIRKIQHHLINNPLCLGEHCEIIRFSYGLIEFDRDFNDHTKIMQLADEAMYENKRMQKSTTGHS